MSWATMKCFFGWSYFFSENNEYVIPNDFPKSIFLFVDYQLKSYQRKNLQNIVHTLLVVACLFKIIEPCKKDWDKN